MMPEYGMGFWQCKLRYQTQEELHLEPNVQIGNFESLQNQFSAGLNMGIAGIPWWTTDIGG